MFSKEEALANIEKSFEALVEIQWTLYSHQTLTYEVRQILLDVAMYYMDILMAADIERAVKLAQRLADKRIERHASEVISGFENLLKDQQN